MLRSAAVLLLVVCLVPAAFAATFTVTSTADNGAGTLRQAILDANATPGRDTILFAADPVLTTSLPAITDAVDIDGSASPSGRHTVGLGDMLAQFMFTFASGSSGSTLRDLELVLLGGNINNHTMLRILSGVTDVLVERNVIRGAITIAGDDNLVQNNHLPTRDGFGHPNFTISGNSNEVLDNTGIAVTVSGLNNRIGAPDAGNEGGEIRVSGNGTIIEANTLSGISVSASNIVIRGNTISGFAFDVEAGIDVFHSGATSVEISQNVIYDTIFLPIDLNRGGHNPNDSAPDSDTGANELQNYPVITSATRSGTSITVNGTLTSAPLTPYDIEIFYDFEYYDELPAQPSPEPRFYLATVQVVTNAAGVATFTHTINDAGPAPLPDPRPVAEFVLATATNRGAVATPGNTPSSTSELSDGVEITGVQPGVLGFEFATYSFNESGQATVTVRRTGGSDGAVSVEWATSQGSSALAGEDYVAANGILNFASGDTEETISVQLVNDAVVEPNESFSLVLLNPTGGAALGTSNANVNIINDDSAATIAFQNTTHLVNEDVGTVTLTVTRSGNTSSSVSVNYTTSNGTATAPADYLATSGTLTFGPGVTTQTIEVEIAGDDIAEPEERFSVTLGNATGASLGTSTATVTIADEDDAGLIEVREAVQDVREKNGSITIVVSRTGGTDGTVTVNYTTSNGTATAPADYTATSGTLTFGPGVTTQTVVIPIVHDSTREGDETFTVTLSNPTGGATLGASVVTITIEETGKKRSVRH